MVSPPRNQNDEFRREFPHHWDFLLGGVFSGDRIHHPKNPWVSVCFCGFFRSQVSKSVVAKKHVSDAKRGAAP